MSRHTARARTGQDRAGVYAEITDKIIAELEAGRIPWVQPWGAEAAKAPLAMPQNASTHRRYSGINVLIVWGAVIERGFSSQSWLTFRQALGLCGNVRKGERGTTVVYADRFTPEEERRRAEETGEAPGAIPFLKRFTVFNTDQCEGLPDEITTTAPPPPPGLIEPQAEALIGLVLSFADFVREYGGLDSRSLLGYAVNQFFANGGQQAYIVRLVQTASADASKNAAAAAVTLDNKLTVTAANPGIWADNYAIITKKSTFDPMRFQLSVVNFKLDPKGVPVEVFSNLSMKADDPGSVVSVLKSQSNFVNATVIGGATDPPADTVFGAQGQVPDTAKLTNGNDGEVLKPNDAAFETALVPTAPGSDGLEVGIHLLDRVDIFNLLCVPGQTNVALLSKLEQFCVDHRAFLIADCSKTASLTDLEKGPDNTGAITGKNATNAAFYAPWVVAPDPLQQNRPEEFPPCGFVAGIYASTDSSRGVWKAPAGTEASLTGVNGVKIRLTDKQNGVVNPLAVNVIRNFPVYGTVVWGARTLQGNDEQGSEWKYIPVRRTALFIEETLYRALKWVVFEPNDEPLWAQIRLNVGAFMHDLFRQGAFQGKTPQDAYFVKCDKETTTQNDINKGIVNIVVGFAPLKPAEFVVIQIQQMAGQIAT